jgi:protein ImuB
MAANSGPTSDSGSYRPLNPPVPIDVRESPHQTPRVIKINGRWRKVVSIVDVCNVDEEWWRERPISRMYYRVDLEGGRRMIVFRDMVDGAWYRQHA